MITSLKVVRIIRQAFAFDGEKVSLFNAEIRHELLRPENLATVNRKHRSIMRFKSISISLPLGV